ncbi:L-ascorbate peroxidase 3-like [Lycium barbarum]|uniref:L-ascorbate peroxidase 3-like n=1 Tax=Lycium barbarum TaxID=112863 RepID=UPI00293E8000|nr:L-ascorbate peroxidase 3-like [Lycium barbarum]
MAAPQVDNEYWDEIAKARVELQNLISKENYSAWDLLRLAYASQFSIANFHHAYAGTSTSTDATTKKTQSAINNLKTKMEKIKRNHLKITYPDLYQLAGVVALQTLGGPKIEFVPGREESEIPPDEGCLPDVSVKGLCCSFCSNSLESGPSDLRAIFHRVGISNSDLIVALCGGLKLARRADAEKSGGQGPKSGDQAPKSGETLKFDNSYFKELNKKGKLPVEAIDKALLNDPEFRSRVHLYAMDEDEFKRHYVVAHKKLSEFGLLHSTFFGSAFENSMLRLKNMPVTLAIAAAVIFSVFYLINRKLSKFGLPHSSFFGSAFENSIVRLKNMPVTQRAVGVAVAAAVVISSVFYLINRRRANKYSSQQFH